MKIPALLKFILLVITAVVIFKLPGLLLGKPIPQSLTVMYLFFSVVMILLVMTSTEQGVRELIRPLQRLAVEPKLRWAKVAVIIVLPLIAAVITYSRVGQSDAGSTVELRTVHPAPPDAFRAFGKRIKTGDLINPYRSLERTDTEAFASLVKEGGSLYFKNCFFCHGAKLDGRGHYAHALKPPPQPFTGSDTIAQLTEGYVFWRIATGAKGLPAEAMPWDSSMPEWHRLLTEDEIWKVILFIYDYTENRPRSFERSGD